MVLVQNPLNKKLSHTLSLNYPNLYGSDKGRIKKTLKINKIKKRNKLSFGSTDENFENLKSNDYFGSQYEKEIIPRTQNNTERNLRKSGALIEELDDQFTWKIEDDHEDENSIDFQYGTLIGNEKVTACVQKFLSDWDSFIGDLGGGEMNGQMDSFSHQNKTKIEEENSSSYKEWLPNNSGYLTPTSQKDDECCSENSETLEEEQSGGSTSEKEIHDQTEMDKEFSKYSPAIIDDFDEICPFENDYNEDERIRSILNAEVLPTDYIGKIPSIPEKPIGYLGRLMKKYNF